MYIDIHSHNLTKADNILEIQNMFLQDERIVEGYFSVGLHPWHISEDSDIIVERIEGFTHQNGLLAIGEIGLDKNIDIPLIDQLSILNEQLFISENYKLPVILHIVKAYSEILKLRVENNFSQPWIIHGFVKKLELAKQMIDKGFYLSFGTALFKDNSNASVVFSKVDLSKVFLETDNNSDYTISEIYERAAIVKGVEVEEIVKQIENNFIEVFKKYRR